MLVLQWMLYGCFLSSICTCVIWMYGGNIHAIFDRMWRHLTLDINQSLRWCWNVFCWWLVLVNVIDIGYFHSTYFYFCMPAVVFPPGFCQAEICQSWPQSMIPTAVGCLHKAQPADNIWTTKTLVPFITHPSWNCLCPSQWRFGSISNHKKKKSVLTLKGISQMRKDVDVRRFNSFQSICCFFIGWACLSEVLQHLNPLQNTKDGSWIDTWHQSAGACFITGICSKLRGAGIRFCNLKNPVWFSKLLPYFTLRREIY